jgi:tetratricopeptide (TPR) repeat protein
MKKLLPLLLFFFSVLCLFSQREYKTDSLENLLKDQHLSDSSRMNTSYLLALKYLNSDNEKTFYYTEQTILYADKISNRHFKGEALSLQGVVYKNKGDFTTAIEKHLKSLKIREEENDTLGRAIAYNDIGILYKEMKNFPKALECYQKSNRLLMQIGNKRGVAFTLGNIGTIFSAMNNLDSALFYYNKSLQLAQELNNRDALTNAYSNIGETYGKRGESAKALEYFKKSLVIDTENNDVY